MTFTDYELIQIDNALEDLLDFIKEGMNPKEAAEEAAYIHDLDDKQYKQLLTRAVIASRGTFYIAE